MLCLSLIVGSIPVCAVSQSEIDALEEQRDILRTKRDNIASQLTSMESDMEALLHNKSVLDEESYLLSQDMLLISQQLAIYEEAVAEKSSALEEAVRNEQVHYMLYCKRVRDMEEHSSWTYLSYILQADDIPELISRMTDVSDIMSADQISRKNYINAKTMAEDALSEYEEILAAEQRKLDELKSAENELNEKIAESSRMIEALEKDIETYTAFQEIAETEFAEAQALVDKKAEELRKQQEAEEALKKQQAAQTTQQNPTGTTYTPPATSGYYMWPSSCTRITSPFGPRIHPLYGQLKPHTGVDIGAWYGTEIYAAAEGTVCTAVLDFGSTGYGSYVAIYHPNGTTTLYAHMSSLAVSNGQYVKQGQIIGYVGSTGASNGPHIHFEIRQNGVCVDPLPYFKISFS